MIDLPRRQSRSLIEVPAAAAVPQRLASRRPNNRANRPFLRSEEAFTDKLILAHAAARVAMLSFRTKVCAPAQCPARILNSSLCYGFGRGLAGVFYRDGGLFPAASVYLTETFAPSLRPS